MAIEFENRKYLFGSRSNEKIDKIYELIQEKNYQDTLRHLSELRGLFYRDSDRLNTLEFANLAFSKFLQHLFLYIRDINRERNLKKIAEEKYAKEMFLKLLTTPGCKEYFFYIVPENTKPMITWTSQIGEDTALIVASESENGEVVGHMLDLLKAIYKQNDSDWVRSECINYLFHENYQGFSAWSIAWRKNNKEIHEKFMQLGKEIEPSEQGFSDFLFQKDNKGNTVLIRSAEGGDELLVNLVIENLSKACGGKNSLEFSNFLQAQNNAGYTALNAACSKQQLKTVGVLLEAAKRSFETIDDFSLFLNLCNQEQESPLIVASKLGYAAIVRKLLQQASYIIFHAPGPSMEIYNNFFNYKDHQGYSALMHACEQKNFPVVQEFMMDVGIVNHFFDNTKLILNMMESKNRDGLSVLHMVIRAEDPEILYIVLEIVNEVYVRHSEFYQRIINEINSEGFSPLDWVCSQEKRWQEAVNQESISIIDEEEANSAGRKLVRLEEGEASSARKKMAQLLVQYGANPPSKENVPEDWEFIPKPNSRRSSLTEIFELFCSSTSSRKKREVNALRCGSIEESYEPSLSQELLQTRKESLFNIQAFLTKSNLETFKQVAMIRNQASISEREKGKLFRFKTIIDYYSTQSESLLARLKQNSAENLKAALAVNSDYVLVDSGSDLLILNKEAIFSSSLLSASTHLFFASFAQQDLSLIEQCLTFYFGQHYTLHPFNYVNQDEMPWFNLDEFTRDPILSDKIFLKSVDGEIWNILQKLFLCNGKIIKLNEIQTPEDFIKENGNKLSFRAERFHEIFLNLDQEKRQLIKNLLKKYIIRSETRYEGINTKERKFLEKYGEKIIQLTSDTEVGYIDHHALVAKAISTHEEMLSEDQELGETDKKILISVLEQLNLDLKKNDDSLKFGAQLLVCLFPSVVRAIAKQNPSELGAIAGVVAADVALRHTVVHLAYHPQIQRIFTGELGSKLLSVAGYAGERVPVMGSALAVYGLTQSAKLLMQTPPEDPNRPLYAHLLVNNLATMGMLAVDVAVALPFWPVLAFFSGLTIHQIEVQGAVVENQLQLLDEQNPLLQFYQRLILGLGIKDARIEKVLTQRELLRASLDYFEKLQSKEAPYALMGVILPDVKETKEAVACLEPGSRFPRPNYAGGDIYIPIPGQTCEKTVLYSDSKKNYLFELKNNVDVCERTDPFYLNSNYTLLISTFTSHMRYDQIPIPFLPIHACEQGTKRKSSYGIITAEDDAAAGIIIDNAVAATTSEKKYSLFLLVDPSQVANYSFKFAQSKMSLLQADSAINSLLPCSSSLAYCVDKIVVAVTQLSLSKVKDTSAKTIIAVNNALRDDVNASAKTLQYLIRYSDDLNLHAKGIDKQAFVFFNETQTFQFEAGKLKSVRGFEVDLRTIKELTLQFEGNYTLAGFFQPGHNQKVVINPFRGFDNTSPAIIDVSDAASYAVVLAGNSQLINGALQMSVQSISAEPVLSSYGAVNSRPLYHFDYLFNQFAVNRTRDVLHFNVLDNETNKPIATVTLSPSDPALRIEFSGRYYLNGKAYFSRMVVRKLQNIQGAGSWSCDLEINIRSNVTESVELSRIEAQGFNSLSLISTEHTPPKSLHYVFLRNTNNPEIDGNFLSYQFSVHKGDLVIILQHRYENAQTMLFLKELAPAIVINKIQYEINWVFSRLLVVATTDDSVIDGRRMLAALKIDKDFSKEAMRYHNGCYTIGGIAIKHPSPKLKVYFNDVKLPFAFLQYQRAMNDISSVEPVAAHLHYRDEKQEKQKEMSFWNRISHSLAYFLSLVGLGTGLSLLFGKRFRWSRPAVVSSGVATVIDPLLNAPGTEAVLFGEKLVPDSLESFNRGLDALLLDSPTGNDNRYKNQTNYANYPADGSTKDWNLKEQQLIFAYYVGGSLKRSFFKPPLEALKPLVRTQTVENKPISISSGISFLATKSLSVGHTVVTSNKSLLSQKV